MGEFLVKLHPDDLKACQMSLQAMDTRALELGLIKRGYQHLWNEFSQKYGLVGKKIDFDYATGLVMEKTEPVERPLDVKVFEEDQDG